MPLLERGDSVNGEKLYKQYPSVREFVTTARLISLFKDAITQGKTKERVTPKDKENMAMFLLDLCEGNESILFGSNAKYSFLRIDCSGLHFPSPPQRDRGRGPIPPCYHCAINVE